MYESCDGQVITFYSFKGGAGRTMALANVGWLLAASGKRVLVVDWDLEAPALFRYFRPFLPAEVVRDAPGVIDLIRQFDTEATRRRRRGEYADIAGYARVLPYAVSLDWAFPGGGRLDFVSSGRQNMDYATTIGSLGWDNFYDKLGGGRLFSALRADMKRHYDYTLIDSRNGLGDIADICVKHLPDTLVDCFTLNTQGIEGAVHVAVDLQKYRVNGTGQRIRVLPVPMRVDDGEKEMSDAGRRLARRKFAGLQSDLSEQQRRDYWSDVEIPYRPFYAYEEILAAFGDENAGPTTLLGAYQRLAGYITDGEVTSAPLIENELRQHCLRRFKRSASSSVSRVLLDYEPEDEAWAEWIGRALSSVGVTTETRHDAARPEDGTSAPLALTVVSRFSPDPDDPRQSRPVAGSIDSIRGRRALFVSDMDPSNRYPADASESIAGLPVEDAVRRLTRLVGCDPVPEDMLPSLSPHYPENVPTINNTMPREPRFTGRAELLRELREKLRTRRCTAVIPDIAPSGVGKTQLALEYAHRFKSEYDVIWWIDCGQPGIVDASLVDLGLKLEAYYEGEFAFAVGGTPEGMVTTVIAALEQARPVKRWLLVFDDADEPNDLRRYIPTGPGHVLITSRNRAWEQAVPASLEIGAFDREESIAHLQRRASVLSRQDADGIAEALGDLPFAVVLSGAWLAETGTAASELAEGPPDSYIGPVLATFDKVLDRVRAHSPAAYLLLELCSFLSAGNVSLSLVYTPAMLELLAEADSRLAEPGDIARHVQTLNRLALIKFGNRSRQFAIHRLLHARIRQRLSAEDHARIRHQAHLLLAANRPRRSVEDPDTWLSFRLLWPHLDPSGAAACDHESVRALLIDRVRYLRAAGSLADAAVSARGLERQWKSMLEAASPDEDISGLRTQLLYMQSNIASISRDQGRYEEAFELDSSVLEQQRELLGNEHRRTLTTADGLAADLRALGRYQEALEAAESVYRTWIDVYGEDYEPTLVAAGNLAVCYRLLGRYADARALDESTYERRVQGVGAGHPQAVRSANAIGRDLRDNGEYARSVAWLTEVVAEACSHDEPSPWTMALAQMNLGASLHAAGRPAEATPVLADAHSTLRGLLGEEHLATLICGSYVCTNLHATEQYAEADQQMRGVLAALRQLLGADHPLMLVNTCNYVALLRSIGETEQALHTARDTADRLLAVVGELHQYTLAAQQNLSICLAEAGELAGARTLAEACVRHLTQVFGAGHPDTLRAAAGLALTREALAEPGAAGELNRLLGRLEESIGREHPSVVALRSGTRPHHVLDPEPF